MARTNRLRRTSPRRPPDDCQDQNRWDAWADAQILRERLKEKHASASSLSESESAPRCEWAYYSYAVPRWHLKYRALDHVYEFFGPEAELDKLAKAISIAGAFQPRLPRGCSLERAREIACYFVWRCTPYRTHHGCWMKPPSITPAEDTAPPMRSRSFTYRKMLEVRGKPYLLRWVVGSRETVFSIVARDLHVPMKIVRQILRQFRARLSRPAAHN